MNSKEQNKTYDLLGFNRIKELLISYTYTENAVLKIQELGSFHSVDKVEYEQELALEMRDLIALDSPLPLLEFPIQDEVIKQVRERKGLKPEPYPADYYLD